VPSSDSTFVENYAGNYEPDTKAREFHVLFVTALRSCSEATGTAMWVR
jgi:hypothetical protein